jgi:hypothetical protein
MWTSPRKKPPQVGGFFMASLRGLLHLLGSLLTRQALADDTKNLFCAPLDGGNVQT